MHQRSENESSEFAKDAARSSPGIAREFWDYFRTQKKWWLIPVVLALLIAAALVILAGTPAGALIYTLF